VSLAAHAHTNGTFYGAAQRSRRLLACALRTKAAVGTKRAPWPWDSPVTLGDAPETQNAARDKRRCKRERRGKRFRETGGASPPVAIGEESCERRLGGADANALPPALGWKLEKLSTRGSDGVVQEGGDCAKGSIGNVKMTQELPAGCTWNPDGTFIPNWYEEDR
jgi:hypothetical protein